MHDDRSTVDGLESDLEAKHCADLRKDQMISPTWMYDWMQDLKDFDSWKKSVLDDEDLSHVFAFRESKIYILKRVRERLHRIQTTMVIDVCEVNVVDAHFLYVQPAWRMLDAIQVFHCRPSHAVPSSCNLWFR
jgi:hypothetical protein